MFLNRQRKFRLIYAATISVFLFAVIGPLAATSEQTKEQKIAKFSDRAQAGKKQVKPADQGGEAKRKKGDGDQPGIRGAIKALDLKKGIITVVHRGDGGTTIHKLSLANKDIKVTGFVRKLSDLRPGQQVFLQLSKVDDVIAIRTARARRRSRVGRVFAAYDKNFDDKVSFAEWLALREGKIDEARRAREKARFDSVDTDRNGVLSFAEFQKWRNPNRRRDNDG